MFFPISTKKNILDTAFCLSTHYSIAKLRAWMELNLIFQTAHTHCYVQMTIKACMCRPDVDPKLK